MNEEQAMILVNLFYTLASYLGTIIKLAGQTGRLIRRYNVHTDSRARSNKLWMEDEERAKIIITTRQEEAAEWEMWGNRHSGCSRAK